MVHLEESNPTRFPSVCNQTKTQWRQGRCCHFLLHWYPPSSPCPLSTLRGSPVSTSFTPADVWYAAWHPLISPWKTHTCTKPAARLQHAVNGQSHNGISEYLSILIDVDRYSISFSNGYDNDSFFFGFTTCDLYITKCPEKNHKSFRCVTLSDYTDWASEVYPSVAQCVHVLACVFFVCVHF